MFRLPKLPDGWTEYWSKKLDIDGVFAYCSQSRKLIEYWNVWFLVPFRYFLVKHERGHSWGIERCLSNSAFCIMAEDDDTWLGKLFVLPAQILGLGMYCGACKKHLEDKGAF